MNEELYRKKALDRIKSPEQLNDYIKVANPGIWIGIVAIIVLLIGVGVWSIFGSLETKREYVVTAQGDAVTFMVPEKDTEWLKPDMVMTIDGAEVTVREIDRVPILAGSEDDHEYYGKEIAQGEWIYKVWLNALLPEGVYKGVIVKDSVSPISFITD